jgi:peroxiredoxin family protein
VIKAGVRHAGRRIIDNSIVIFLHSSRYDRLYQAVNLMLTASSMDWRCHLFLFFGALASFMEGSWDEVNILENEDGERIDQKNACTPAWMNGLQENLELANFPSLYSLVDKSRDQKIRARIYACSTSVRLLNLAPGEVKIRVDEIVGLSTMLQIAADAKHVIYI